MHESMRFLQVTRAADVARLLTDTHASAHFYGADGARVDVVRDYSADDECAAAERPRGGVRLRCRGGGEVPAEAIFRVDIASAIREQWEVYVVRADPAPLMCRAPVAGDEIVAVYRGAVESWTVFGVRRYERAYLEAPLSVEPLAREALVAFSGRSGGWRYAPVEAPEDECRTLVWRAQYSAEDNRHLGWYLE